MDETRPLEAIAQQLVARVRDDDPAANLRWLRTQLGTDPTAPLSDAERLLFVVAIAVPVDWQWWDLTEWARSPEEIEQRKALRRRALLNATARSGGARRRKEPA